MAETKRDNNQNFVMTGALNTDGNTPARIYANPASHILQTSDGDSGSNVGGDISPRDNNGVPVLMAVSNDDEMSPVNLFVDSNGNLLIKST